MMMSKIEEIEKIKIVVDKPDYEKYISMSPENYRLYLILDEMEKGKIAKINKQEDNKSIINMIKKILSILKFN